MVAYDIPKEADWGDYKKDLDQKSAFISFAGRSNDEMQSDFYKNIHERVSELRFMPTVPFRYYVIGLRDFIVHGEFAKYESADIANCFLSLVEDRLENQSESIMLVVDELMPVVEEVCRNQKKYDAPEDIYGNFMDKLTKIHEIIDSKVAWKK